jgi:Concanavalin A-like lectin/glucanases superfamily/Dolichyl-phosphate-mannose-protein mannosyltransferase
VSTSRPIARGGSEPWVGLTGAAVLVVGLTLRIFALGGKSFSEDEGYTISVARGSVGQIWTSLISDHVPLYFGVMWLWARAVGEAEWVVRLPSVVFGIACLGAVLAIGADLGHRRAGLIAAFLGAVSPFAVYWSQEAKPVTLQMAIAVWSTWALLRATRRRQRRWWAAWWVLSLVGIYSHYYHGFVLIGQGLWILISHLGRRDWRAALALAGSQVVLVLAFLPWVFGHADLISRQVPQFARPAPVPLPSLVTAASTALLAGDPGQGAPLPIDLPLGIGAASVVALGLLSVARERRLVPVVTLSAVVIATTLIGAHVLDQQVPHFAPRYLIGVLPLVHLLVALGLETLFASIAIVQALGLAALGALTVAWGSITFDTYTGLRYQHAGFREVVDYFVTHRSKGDLLTGDPAWMGPTYRYYLNGADTFLELPFLTGKTMPGERVDVQIRAWRAAGIEHVWSASRDGVPSRLDLELDEIAQPTDLRYVYQGAAIQQYALNKNVDTTAAFQRLAQDYPSVVLDDHPTAYWRLDDAYGPAARSRVSAAPGSYRGGYILGVEGAIGDGNSAVRFNGEDGFVSVPNVKLPPTAEAVSVEAWLKSCRPLRGIGSNRWMGKIQQVGLLGIGWEGWNGGWTVQLTTDHDQMAVDAPMDVEPGQWLHLVGTYDGSTLRIYVNGRAAALRQIGAQRLMAPTGEFSIGGVDSPTRDSTWDGFIDDVALYDHALSAEAVDRHFRAAHPPRPAVCPGHA